MDEASRRAIAYIAARAATGKRANAVYDYGTAHYHSMDGEVSADRVTIYDYGRGCYIDGRGKSLYDYGRGSHIDLEPRHGQPGKFKGYDYGTGSYYDVDVRGASVSIYDYETGQYHEYSI